MTCSVVMSESEHSAADRRDIIVLNLVGSGVASVGVSGVGRSVVGDSEGCFVGGVEGVADGNSVGSVVGDAVVGNKGSVNWLM